MVPRISHVSGMTLLVVPAWMLATVTTVGSNTSTRRVTMVWMACTISQAIGHRIERAVGLRGVAAGALHRDAQRVRRRHDRPLPGAHPAARQRRGDVDGGRGVDRARGAVGQRRHVEQALLQHVPGAVVALLAGLEHEQHPPGQVGPAGGQQPGRAGEHGHVRVVPAGVHGAVDLAGEVQAGLLGHGQRVHVAAQQDGRPRLVAGEQGGDAAGLLVQVDVQPEAVDLLEYALPRGRQVVADLGTTVEVAPEADGAGEQVPGFLLERVEGHARHGRHAVCRPVMPARPPSWSTSSTTTTGWWPSSPGPRCGPERLRHRCVFIVVRRTDGRLLVHQRSASKDLWPSAWDVAAGGVVVSGEGWDEAAARELAEEVGIGGVDAACWCARRATPMPTSTSWRGSTW